MLIKKTVTALAVFILCFPILAFASNAAHSGLSSVKEPYVKVSAHPAFGLAPLTVSFDASNFLYHYGNKLSFSWDFNDGGKAREVSTTHTFHARGTYLVALTVTTPFGQKNSWLVIIVN